MLYLQEIPAGGVTLNDWNRLTEQVESMYNPNLLINTDFRNPVNQRGQSEYTAAWEYCIDMWLLGGDGQVYVNEGYLKIIGAFDQYIDYRIPVGTAVTFTVKLRNGNLYSKTLIMDVKEQVYKIEGTEIYATLFAGETPDDSKYTRVRFYFPLQERDDNFVQTIKVELGPFSTLANEVVDYAAELRKCQRYLQVIPAYNTFRAAYVDNSGFKFNIPIEGMRINPSLSGSIAICGIDNAVQVDFIMSAYTTDNMIVIAANKNSHGLKDAIFATGDKGAILSAEL